MVRATRAGGKSRATVEVEESTISESPLSARGSKTTRASARSNRTTTAASVKVEEATDTIVVSSVSKTSTRKARSAATPVKDEAILTHDVGLFESRMDHGAFAGVVIPKMSLSAVKNELHESSSTSASSVISSSRDARSVEFETPLTSHTVTPAESVSHGRLSSIAKGKRKRVVAAIPLALNDDERLAQELQAAEYAEAGDGDDTIADASEVKYESSDDLSSVDSDVIYEPTSKRRKGNASTASSASSRRKTNLPLRKARLSGQLAFSSDAPLKNESSVADDFLNIERDAPASDNESELEYYMSDSDDEETDAFSDASSSAAQRPDNGPAVARSIREQWRTRRRRNRALIEREKLENAHPEIMTMWTELEAIPRIPTRRAQQPESITRQLKSFQLEGLNWLRKQEQTRWKGGLLGDEMGMGKTIQAVSLIMSDYPQKQPTLVVVPPVALMQWTNEIGEYTDGKLKVLVFHGTNSKARGLSVKELQAFDVIMISYAGLESIYRKEIKGWTRADKIVKEDSAIHSIHYHRLILDEAHSIKSRTTGVAKACFALKATYKWCLSGTPVQNRIGEFFSLLRFLEVTPYANYFCKSCDCSILHWAIDANHRCKKCGHRGLDHVSVFNQEILNPITSGESESTRKEALRKLRLITDHIMLRRVKRDHTASMELPPKEIVLRQEFFGEIERDFSSSIMSNTTRQFDTYVSRGVMLNNYANIFGLIMQMRQISDHPDLLLKKHAEGGQNVLVCNICDEPAEEAIRSRCKHEFCRACAKDYVRSCEGTGAIPDCPKCHIALSIDFDQPEIEQDEDVVKKSSIINRIKMENWTSSTKIEMLVYDLWKLRSKRQTTKSIVFSQFTSMLQLIEWRLRRAGFNTVMLDGSMSPAQRQRSIEYFMNNTDVEVFLVSLKAGGVALNLTEASRVFIVDPWWNPAAEWQSADRCHRIGQKRPCVITRMCIEDSVESRIVMLQEKKANMINGTVNNDDVAMEKLTPEDMQFLFRGS